MIDIEWEKIAIILLTFTLGFAIGHVQEWHWHQYEIKALHAQIERQSCDDINPWK